MVNTRAFVQSVLMRTLVTWCPRSTDHAPSMICTIIPNCPTDFGLW
jgi:hypothetical protein